MELDKTTKETSNAIEQIENETKLLLETVRGKSKSSNFGNNTLKKANQVKGKTQSTLKSTLQNGGDTVDLFSLKKNSDLNQKTLDENVKKTLNQEAEKNMKNLSFDFEKNRILSQKDTFVPSASIKKEDIEKERLRLLAIEESSRLKAQMILNESKFRTIYLQEDKSAIKIQSLFRGHIGRRKVKLILKIKNHLQSEKDESDWIEVTDKETGDIWYYNKSTNQSQWDKPDILKEKENSGNRSIKKKKVKNLDGTKELDKAMTLPTIKAIKSLKSPKTCKPKSSMGIDPVTLQEINNELGINKLIKKEALMAPDGSFKPHLRNVVMDALVDTRFDNVSTVLADNRWYDKNQDHFDIPKTTKSVPSGGFIESKIDVMKTPMVAKLKLKNEKADRMIIDVSEKENDQFIAEEEITAPSQLTINNIEHNGFEDQSKTTPMCFGCWSSGMNRKCSLHTHDIRIKPSETMLLCRNWDLDVMRRRYRSEEIQEVFLQKEASLRYDAKRRKFYTVVEQRHPIYRMKSHLLERFNNTFVLFSKIKYWLHSLAEQFKLGNVHPKSEIAAKLMRARQTVVNLTKVQRFSSLNRHILPLAPITGYSWPERLGEIQFLFKQHSLALGHEIDIIDVKPMPVPKVLYQPREYNVSLPKTIPLPQSGTGEIDSKSGPMVLPTNTFIDDMNPAGWLERICSSAVRDNIEMALAQIKALTPVYSVEVNTLSKRSAPTTIKFATIGQKPAPGNMAVGGLALEQTIYHIISTYFPPQYGDLMLMDKSSISPGITPEATITFESLIMPPTLEPYVERPLEHQLTFRRPPTITLNSSVSTSNKHFYGINRPEQTGEQESHGFRTTAWAPMLLTYSETDPQVFVPGQGVVSLNIPKANTSFTTHADSSYPFCEPSTKDNSTLDFYHLLLTGVVSSSKAQIFTALTVQEPGQFQKSYRLDTPMGHLVVNVYRSWAFTQRDTIQKFFTDDGIPYWYHRKTGQTFWERPLYEEEESSPLLGGTVLDIDHPEEPSILTKGNEGASRRYLQGEFRNQMLMHLETKKEALNRRKAANSTLKNAKERGVVPDIAGMNSTMNVAPGSIEMGSRFDFEKPQNSSLIPHSATDFNPSQEMAFRSSEGPDDIMQMYSMPQQNITQSNNNQSNNNQFNIPPSQGGQMIRGSNLDDPSWINTQAPMNNLPTNQGNSIRPTSNQINSNLPSSNLGVDMNLINNLSQTMAMMFNHLSNANTNNPQDMIQLGLGMGMALMQSGAVHNVVQGQISQTAPIATNSRFDRNSSQFNEGNSIPEDAVAIPAISEEMSSQFSDFDSHASRVSRGNPEELMNRGKEPIGLSRPTIVFSSDKLLDHSEEIGQRTEISRQIDRPLNTVELARNLKIEPAITDTPDIRPPKVLTNVRPSNAEDEVKENNLIPLVAYPELSNQYPGGAPLPYNIKPPAGLGISYVSKEEELSQLKVPGADHLRRTVMPLPVGFFEAIEAKHVAQQAADYLPQVPNLPQSRTIGRVKPRSAAADWLMISFDPWSAGKNPLSTEYVPSLMEKADRLLGKEGGAKAADAIETLRQTTVSGAFVRVEDEEGLAQQRADITKAQVMAEDFRKLCSLCRHNKFADAEQLINQPDWSVPIDYQDDQGNALIHVAAQNGSKRLIKLCLRRGANLDLQNLTGQTALHFAFGYGYNEVGEYLVSKGADDSVRNKDGLTCYEGLGARELALL